MIYFVRHGATDWNEHINSKGEREAKCQGTANIPLNKHGIEQAKQAHELLKDVHFDRVICSPLDRTKQTCSIIYTGDKEVEYDERIKERDFGEFEGLMASEFDFNDFWKRNTNYNYKSAEPIEHFEKRIYDFLDEMKDYNGNILVVSHGGVSCVLSCYFNGIPNEGYGMKNVIKNCTYCIFDYNKIQR